MKWRGFETESPSGLHYTNWHWSTDHPMGRSSNHHCIGSTMAQIRIGSGSPATARISPNYSERSSFLWELPTSQLFGASWLLSMLPTGETIFFSSSGEKHIMCFMRALQRLVIFGGSSDIACFWASVMSGPTSCHFMIDFSFFPHALLLFQEQLMLNGQNTHEMDHCYDAVRQMNLVCIYMETIGSFWSQWLRWLWIEVE